MTIRLQPSVQAIVMTMIVMCAWTSIAQEQATKVTVPWDKVTRVSQTTPTLQVVVNPLLERGTPCA